MTADKRFGFGFDEPIEKLYVIDGWLHCRSAKFQREHAQQRTWVRIVNGAEYVANNRLFSDSIAYDLSYTKSE